jgi:NAD(P)-dependent dehydrogenase (short-subunit alcohol dehydrogenase family)
MYLTTRALMPLLLKSETKTIINNSSSGAHALLYSAYQPAKLAVTRLTELVAANYNQFGVIAMSIHPGRIKTEIGMQVPTEFHHMLKDSLGLPSDTVVWLCKERRDWLNGRYVSANWDMEELEAKKEDIAARDVLKFRLTV